MKSRMIKLLSNSFKEHLTRVKTRILAKVTEWIRTLTQDNLNWYLLLQAKLCKDKGVHQHPHQGSCYYQMMKTRTLFQFRIPKKHQTSSRSQIKDSTNWISNHFNHQIMTTFSIWLILISNNNWLNNSKCLHSSKVLEIRIYSCSSSLTNYICKVKATWALV